MLTKQTQFYIQKIESIKHSGLHYAIVAHDETIASITEQKEHASSAKNRSLKLFSSLLLSGSKRLIIESVYFEVRDVDGTIYCTIHKAAGLEKPLTVYDLNGEPLYIIISNVKMKNPSITVQLANGEEHFIATGNYGATSFSVKEISNDGNDDRFIGSIQQKSLVYESMKEAFFNNDVYAVTNQAQSELNTLFIALILAIDLYFHAGN